MTLALRLASALLAAALLGTILACGSGAKPAAGGAPIATKADNTGVADYTGPAPEAAPGPSPEKSPLAVDEAEEAERAQRLRDRGRRDELRKARPAALAKLAKEDAAYLLAKAELEATRKLNLCTALVATRDERARDGNAREADRLDGIVRADCDGIVKLFPGTAAARDAADMRGGKRVPARALPPDPDDPKAIPADRMPGGVRAVDAVAIEEWGVGLAPVPAPVVTEGVLRDIPYRSFRAGDIEVDVFGDPDSPARIEFGVGGASADAAAAQERCIDALASLLDSAGDRRLLRSIGRTGGLKVRGGLTFEVTAATAPHAHGFWRVAVYSRARLEESRAAPGELGAITAAKPEPPRGATAPASAASPSFAPSRPGGSVYVQGYTKKDGTYVAPYTRSAPGTKGGKR